MGLCRPSFVSTRFMQKSSRNSKAVKKHHIVTVRLMRPWTFQHFDLILIVESHTNKSQHSARCPNKPQNWWSWWYNRKTKKVTRQNFPQHTPCQFVCTKNIREGGTTKKSDIDSLQRKIYLKIIGTNYEKRSRKCEVTKERLT